MKHCARGKKLSAGYTMCLHPDCTSRWSQWNEVRKHRCFPVTVWTYRPKNAKLSLKKSLGIIYHIDAKGTQKTCSFCWRAMPVQWKIKQVFSHVSQCSINKTWNVTIMHTHIISHIGVSICINNTCMCVKIDERCNLLLPWTMGTEVVSVSHPGAFGKLSKCASIMLRKCSVSIHVCFQSSCTQTGRENLLSH